MTYSQRMSWFAVRVRLQADAPTADAAQLLAREVAHRISALLDYAEYRIEDSTTASANPGEVLDRYLVEVSVLLEAETADQAHGEVRDVVAELRDHELDVGGALEIEDPRRPTGTTLTALAVAQDILLRDIDADLEALRRGAAYEDTAAVSYHLPKAFAHRYTVELVELWRRSVARVAEKLAAYPDTYLATTAEELAAHALIEEAKAWLEDSDGLGDGEKEDANETLEEMHDLAFEDHDVLMLFERRFDGLEESDIAETFGMINLHPHDWFKPFRAGRP